MTPLVEEKEQVLLSKIRDQIQQGLTALRRERGFTLIQDSIDFIAGEQSPLKGKALSKTVDNRMKKVLFETTSALTDVRPIWNYHTYNERFKAQGEILNKLARAWWRTNQVDLSLQAVLAYAMVGGSGYGALIWNPDLPGGGDFTLLPFDPRDVVPIDPVFSRSIQDWGGVVLRQKLPVETCREMFPEKRAKIVATGTNWFDYDNRVGRKLTQVLSTAWGVISGGSSSATRESETVDLFRVFVKDPAVNATGQVVSMGHEGEPWYYEVPSLGTVNPKTGETTTKEEARLYPRGRLIICTPTAVLDDGPNPYWHGFFPVVRFTLDYTPWSLLGEPIIQGLMPLQHSLNEGLRGIEDGMGQWIKRGVIADKNAISQKNLESIDTRKSGMQVMVNPTAGDGFKVVDGPIFPDWYMEMISYYKGEIDELSGIRGLQQLSQMRQIPSAETVDRYMEALSPTLRLRARNVEVALGELAELLKVGFFQYYTVGRRVQILGPDGMTLEDFDYDPGKLVPSDAPGNDAAERAQNHHKNFTFSIAPNSFLNVSHNTQKMMMLQLLRGNMLDPWTAWETMDVANIGQPPAETVPDRIIAARKLGLLPGPTPEMVQAQEAMVLAQAQQVLGQMAMMQNTQGQPGGMMGGGAPVSGVGPQGGRPPSGGQAPAFVQKDGGTRTVVSESGP